MLRMTGIVGVAQTLHFMSVLRIHKDGSKLWPFAAPVR